MKAKGDKATYASAAPTGSVMGELYKVETGVKAVEVTTRPRRTAQRYDERCGRLRHARSGFALAQQREGRLRILGVSTGKRLEATPELPDHGRAGRGDGPDRMVGGDGSEGTPKPIVDQFNKWLVDVIGSPETKAFLNKFGGDPLIERPKLAQARLIKDVDNWKKYIEIAKIVPQG